MTIIVKEKTKQTITQLFMTMMYWKQSINLKLLDFRYGVIRHGSIKLHTYVGKHHRDWIENLGR